MSKELKALKELRKEIVGAYYHDMEWFSERYDIIETALKEYEGAKNHIKALNKAKEMGKKVEMVWDKDTKTVKPMIVEDKNNA